MNVYVVDEAALSLDNLIDILYHNEYFGFTDSAENYVNRIYDFIYLNIHSFPNKISPKALAGLGTNYIFYKINPRTTWYIFFEKNQENYLVTQIINNHCEEAKWL